MTTTTSGGTGEFYSLIIRCFSSVSMEIIYILSVTNNSSKMINFAMRSN